MGLGPSFVNSENFVKISTCKTVSEMLKYVIFLRPVCHCYTSKPTCIVQLSNVLQNNFILSLSFCKTLQMMGLIHVVVILVVP